MVLDLDIRQIHQIRQLLSTTPENHVSAVCFLLKRIIYTCLAVAGIVAFEYNNRYGRIGSVSDQYFLREEIRNPNEIFLPPRRLV